MKKIIAMIALCAAFGISTPAFSTSCECASPLNLNVYCGPDGGILGYGSASVTGGVGPYTYSWTAYGATIYGSSTNSYIDVIGSGGVTVVCTVTDSCGTSRTKSCFMTLGGSGGPLKVNAPEAFAAGMNVQQTLEMLESIKDTEYRVAFDGIQILDFYSLDNLMNLPVHGLVDEGSQVTLMLNSDEREPVTEESEREAVER